MTRASIHDHEKISREVPCRSKLILWPLLFFGGHSVGLEAYLTDFLQASCSDISVYMQEDVEATVAAWSVYGGYAKEKDELLPSQWAEVRLQLHRVDDFLGRWLKSASSMEASPMKLTLLRELDSYRRCVTTAIVCMAH